MPRLFTALELPPMARTHLSLVRGEIGGARWVAVENLHLTLRFFGDVTDAAADELAARLDELHADPFDITIAGTGTFGGTGETVIYAAVAETSALAALQKSHERIARSLGLGAPEHPFKPHITLARVRYARASALARFLAETSALTLPPIPITEFVLLSSRPGRGGGPYALELAVPLGDGVEPSPPLF
jgi:RNA 2',3'-cyclic 3'-phosphodiesterase